jgi:hypothetical protein
LLVYGLTIVFSGIKHYKENSKKLLKKVKAMFPSSTQLIWLTSPPISVDVWGGLMVEGMEFLKNSMRFNVMEGNTMIALNTAAYGFDVVDLHYWMVHQIHKRMPDGIHWTQDAVRLQLNIVLTHYCLSREVKLPGRWGGQQNRPLESARRIADAAVAVVGDHKQGPPAKRLRLEGEPQAGERVKEERHVVLVDTNGINGHNGINGNQAEEVDADEANNLELDCFDVVVAAEVRVVGSATVEAKVLCGQRVAGRAVVAAHHPSVTRAEWQVQPGKVEVGGSGRLFLKVVGRGQLRVGDLVAQVTL